MPNWCNNSGSITLPENASPAAKAAFHVLANPNPTIGWMSNVLPSPEEMHTGIDHAMGKPECMSLNWLAANSKFVGDFGTFIGDDRHKDFRPTKEYLAYLNYTFGAENWYTWNIKNYGTKWDVTPEVLDVSENTIDFACESAWSPITKFMEYLGSLGLKVRLDYDEPGAAFRGELTNHTEDGTFESVYMEDEEYLEWRVLVDGQDIDNVFYNLDEYQTFEDYEDENDVPDSKELVERIKTYYNEKNSD